jgi:two-component system, OmpR family, sensor histidine kinase CpxA
MSDLVNEVLSFSKAQISSAGKDLVSVNVAATLAHVLQRERPEDTAISVNVADHLNVIAHPDFLFRALANLVRNAVRYAGHAGPISITAKEEGQDVWITVADQGPGLPETELDQVFKPFYRPEFARQRDTGGVGLGLAIVRSCVEACGGAVECRNRSPHGLEVEIRLAAASHPSNDPAPALDPVNHVTT